MSSTEQPWRASARVRLFALVFGVSLALGLVWTLFQPLSALLYSRMSKGEEKY